MHVSGTYDLALVTLSFLVASFASYTALDLGGRIRASAACPRVTWLVTAAVAMGGGIWSMHFIGMLAFLMPMPVSFDLGPTVLSLVVAVAVTGVGFYVIGTRHATSTQLALSGVFMGFGIVAMHYTGMAAMRMGADLHYDRLFVTLSVLIAIGAATAALWLSFRTAATWQRLTAALVMGFAICGMHYTGMAAARFSAHGTIDQPQTASLAQTDLALATAGITFLILILALAASHVDKKFAGLAQRETELLRESEEQLIRLYRETPVPLHATDLDGRLDKVSDTWLTLLGFDRGEVLGRKLTDFMTDASRLRYDETAWPALQRRQDIREAEYQFVRRSGEVLDVLLNARQEQRDGHPVRILGGLIDVTARKRAEEALRQSQRMEAVGQVTGGVAHDFNNLLMVVSGAAAKIRRTLSDEALIRPLEMIETAVKRGSTLTGHLLSFARRQTLEAKIIDLVEAVPKLAELLRRSLRGDIEVRTKTTDRPCRVRVDQGELELAVLNLGVNARDAMPDGGILVLSIRSVVLDGSSDVEGLHGNFVAIELEDTGKGIPPEMLPRVFDPFFTTKGVGKGTGLGLSQVYGFAKQSGGIAMIRSKLGFGTTVSILLPASDTVEAAPRDGDATGLGRDAVPKPGTVLVVEDSESVAAVVSEYFSELGFATDCAESGAAALRKLQSERPYDLVFSDILMTGSVTGLELARIVRTHHAETSILLTTGYSEKAQEAITEGFRVLRKPYDMQSLAAAIRLIQSQQVVGAD
jgi:PAS domain S-box-containing protein